MKYIFAYLFSAIILFSQSQLDEANKLMLKNNYSKAAKILEEFVKSNESPEAYLKLGLCYKNLIKNNDALSAIEKADEIDSNNIDILTNLALLYSTIGFSDKAKITYQKVFELDPENVFAKINLAKLFLDSGKWSNAKSIYFNLAKSDSSNSFYYRQLGYIYQKENKIDDAYRYYGTAYALNPQDHFTISNLAKVYFQKEQSDSAIAIINKGLETFVNNTQLLKLKSDIYFSLKNYSGAVNAIVRLIANGDDSAQLYQRLGICYYQIAVENFVGEAQFQKLESAVEALNKSATKDSTQSLTELYLGLTFKELNKNEEAITHLQKVIELIYPRYTSAIFTNLAIVHNREKNYAKAIKNFKTAKKFDQENPNYFYYLASTYDQYYIDKQVPLIYYQLYLSSSNSLDTSLKKYAISRIEELKEAVHFQAGSKKNK